MANRCPNENCSGELLLQQRRPLISVAGLFGAAIALLGFIYLFFNPILAVLLIVVGLLFGHFGAGKINWAICPLCGYSKRVPRS